MINFIVGFVCLAAIVGAFVVYLAAAEFVCNKLLKLGLHSTDSDGIALLVPCVVATCYGVGHLALSALK